MAVGQYWAKTALFSLPDCPATVVFQPEPLPVASFTPKFVIVVFVVCDPPLSVTSGNAGIAGLVENASVPAFTANSALSS